MKEPTICIIGAGFGGICAGIQLQKQLGLSLNCITILDENGGYGGTWWLNRYPGCECDSPSHQYSLSFEKNPNWSKVYSGSAEIRKYLTKVSEKYDLPGRTQFNIQVKSLAWNDAGKFWKVEILEKNTGNVKKMQYDYVINSTGALRIPHIPEEFNNYTGEKYHSARYDENVDLKGKKVAVVGSGASAVQIIPAIAHEVKELHCYQRKPGWVLPRTQFNFPHIAKLLFAIFPFLMTIIRFIIFLYGEIHHPPTQTTGIGPKMHPFGVWVANMLLKFQIKDEKLREKLRPNYLLGCKRITFHFGYYPAFNLPQVYLNRETIVKIEGKSIETADGKREEFDVLILATGFKTYDYFAPMKVTGVNNNEILPLWKDNGPSTYYGIMSNLLPNYFGLLGPNTILGHNSVIFMIECQVNFAMQVIKESIIRESKFVAVKKSAEDKWMKEITGILDKTIWKTGQCGSWYADKKGKLTQLWPKNCIDYNKEIKNVNFNHLEFSF